MGIDISEHYFITGIKEVDDYYILFGYGFSRASNTEYDSLFFVLDFAGNIIVNLASLPDFLRTPMLKKRMMEFFSLEEQDRKEVINNALEAGPTIPFPNFSKLFKTWLEVLCAISEENRHTMFSNYIKHIINSPQKIIAFNLDGILEIFLSLGQSNQEIISISIQNVIKSLDQDSKRKLVLLIPENAKNVIGF